MKIERLANLKPRTILAVDSATGPSSMAILRGETLLANAQDENPSQQSARLVLATDGLVREALKNYSALDAIAVTTGPGGFTGIRIALAAARGMALAANKPIMGISTLETLAWQALANKPAGSKAAAIVNAYREQIYAQSFTRTQASIQALGEAETVDIFALAEWMKEKGVQATIGNLSEASVFAVPQAEYTARLALVYWQEEGDAAFTKHPPEAFYIRPPDAKPQTPLLAKRGS